MRIWVLVQRLRFLWEKNSHPFLLPYRGYSFFGYDTMEAIDHIIPFLKGDADMIRLVCNTLRKLLCMSDEGYETFLMDLEDYKSELEERE